MAQSGSNGLVEQFGQMGRRRIQMANVPPNGDADSDATDPTEDNAVPDLFDLGDATPDAVVEEEPALAVATA
jgi:hypothetical protein